MLILGLPYMRLLSVAELRTVIAHEFGHYAGGDTKLGGWIYRTRAAIGRTIDHLSSDDDDEGWMMKAVRLPFIWYGKAFMRITAAISRRQEFAADEWAAKIGGREAHMETLRRAHASGPAFDSYWSQEVVPAFTAGARPPIADGYTRYLEAEPIKDAS